MEELRRRRALTRAVLERYPVVLAGVVAAVFLAFWRLDDIQTFASRWYPPETAVNLVSEAIGVLVGGLVTYFVVDYLQKRRERQRAERELAPAIKSISNHVGWTARVLLYFASEDRPEQERFRGYVHPQEEAAGWVEDATSRLGDVIREQESVQRIAVRIADPTAGAREALMTCLSGLIDACEAVSDRPKSLLPARLLSSIETLQRVAGFSLHACEQGTRMEGRVLAVATAAHLFICYRNRHRPEAVYGPQESTWALGPKPDEGSDRP